jgi:DnaJ domain
MPVQDKLVISRRYVNLFLGACTMEPVRFHPPCCSIRVVLSDAAPRQGQFRYDRDADGAPANPELFLPAAVDRARAFVLALEYERRWLRIQEDFVATQRAAERQRRREEEAAGRWDQIRGEWERRKRRWQQPSESEPLRPADGSGLACLSVLGLSWPCDRDEIRRAFREKAKALHPDRGGSESAFIQLREAYLHALRLRRP